MRIIVVGTPKTGNTWVKHLLADVYNLPIVTLKPEFDAAEATAAGARWISHQHYLPKHGLLTWAKANGVIFISVLRHPADVVISLWHHMQRRQGKNAEVSQGASVLGKAADNVAGETTLTFVEQEFPLYLNLSVAWLQIPGVRALRYENLWNHPIETLTQLTDTIEPRSRESLNLSLCACELGLMQQLLDPEKKLIRQGGTGAWRHILPDNIKAAFTQLDPYPAQFAALGYTMDESDPANVPQANPAKVNGPFSDKRHFDNGTPITPVLMKAYFDLPINLRARWLAPHSTSRESFFTWLNQPAAADPIPSQPNPVISELAHYIYGQRSDLQTAFPDHFGTNRSEFYDWFLFNARKEYSLPSCFVTQNPFSDATKFSDDTVNARILVRAYLNLPEALRARWPDPSKAGKDSYLTWLKTQAKADPSDGKNTPIITELGAYLYSIRSDVRSIMPDLYGMHRVDFADWFISSAAKEYRLDRSLILPVINSWAQVGTARESVYKTGQRGDQRRA
jgi:hypothetical protein